MRKIMIIGHARHGKDTVAELLGLKFESTSMALCKDVIYPALANFYDSPEACYNDRINNRELWAALIRDYCTPDKARAAKLIYETSDVYVGCRNYDEFASIRAQLDPYVIWVDASHRKPLESTMQLRSNLAHYYLGNNSTLEDLKANVKRLADKLGREVYPTSSRG